MRLIDLFDSAAALHADKLFLLSAAESRSYSETQTLSHQIANAFAKKQIAPGTIAAVFAGNSIRAFECVIGLLRAGCVWAPVNPRGAIEDSVYAFNNTDTEVVFYSAELGDAVRQIRAHCASLKQVICIEEPQPGAPSLDQFIYGMPAISKDVPRAALDIATLMSSGGTTGAPKGVMMPNIAWATMAAATLQLQACEKPVHLIAAPMTHAAGGSALLMAAMGATNVVLHGFDPEEIMQAIPGFKATHLFLPPTAIYRMLAHPRVRDYDYSSLRFFNYASAPMAPERVKQAMDVFGPVMMTAFGQMETGILNTFFSPQDHAMVLASGDERRLQSCGRASPFVRIEIMDEEGHILPQETTGEIVVQSDQLMLGYYKKPEETARSCVNGWRRTGDIGFKDGDGWLFLVDRKHDMIISGGFNIFPAEIEKVLIANPAVQDCVVVGVPDKDWGEAVTAVLELKPGEAASPNEIRLWARERLSGVKTPKQIHIWPDLPRSAAGKILRRKVRDHFWQGTGRRI